MKILLALAALVVGWFGEKPSGNSQTARHGNVQSHPDMLFYLSIRESHAQDRQEQEWLDYFKQELGEKASVIDAHWDAEVGMYAMRFDPKAVNTLMQQQATIWAYEHESALCWVAGKKLFFNKELPEEEKAAAEPACKQSKLEAGFRAEDLERAKRKIIRKTDL